MAGRFFTGHPQILKVIWGRVTRNMGTAPYLVVGLFDPAFHSFFRIAYAVFVNHKLLLA
jgi:hypothetical protein